MYTQLKKSFGQMLSNATEKNHAPSQIVKQSLLAMGTIVSFTARATSNAQAKEAFAKAIEEMARLEHIFSRHNPSSALSLLNQEGRLSHAPQELLYVLEKSKEISLHTQEIYNPAIKPLLDLFEEYQDAENLAKNIPVQEVKERQELILLSEVKIERNSIVFQRQNMAITLDSLAKGYIIDCLSHLLIKEGIENHIINAGGDIIAKGRKSPSEAWTIGIENPNNPAQLLTSFALENAAVATSGAYQKFFDKQMQRHHIINPKNAHSPLITSLSCKAQSAMLADAYATVNSLCSDTIFSKFLIK